MINSMQLALIKKDIRGIVQNKRLFSVLLIVPLVMAVFIPSLFVLIVAFASDGIESVQPMLDLLDSDMLQGDLKQIAISLVLNSVVPLFFLLIPIMAASVMAASSFVGEKEKRTLETLLYCPMTLRQIYHAKILASFFLSMAVSFSSFALMILVVEVELWLVMGSLILPGISWLILMLLVSPALSLFAITLIVRGSAKAKTMEESQQRSVFLILPVILLAMGQFTGLLLVNSWLLLGIGLLFAVIALVFMRRSFASFHYEKLLE